MILNEFIQGSSDENLLKSLPTEGISEDLIKAMNKAGLVQKEVQVRGKNGQTFTRKQWVKASDTQSDKSSSKSQGKEDKNTAIIVDGGSITHYPKGVTPMFHGGKSYKYSAHVNGSNGADKYFNSEDEARAYIKKQSEGSSDLS